MAGGSNKSGEEPANPIGDYECSTQIVTTTWYSRACDSSGCEDPVIIGVEQSIQTNCAWSPGGSAAGVESNCGPEEGEIPIIEPDLPGVRICNRFIPFYEVPGDNSELSFTGGVTRVVVRAEHSETKQQLEAYWGGWCITFGTSANEVTNPTEASGIFKEAFYNASQELEIWLNTFQESPGNLLFSQQFLFLFEEELQFLSSSNGQGYVKVTPGNLCFNMPYTQLDYSCN